MGERDGQQHNPKLMRSTNKNDASWWCDNFIIVLIFQQSADISTIVIAVDISTRLSMPNFKLEEEEEDAASRVTIAAKAADVANDFILSVLKKENKAWRSYRCYEQPL